MTARLCLHFLAPAVLALILSVSPWLNNAVAVEPDEQLSDPVLENRARELSKEIRCVVCQNQSIDDSNAGIAKTMRVVVRERLELGDSDEEVKNYLVKRYGDYVLLKPPFKASTLLLWIGPAVILLIGIIVLVNLLRRQTTATKEASLPSSAPLSAEEEARLAELMNETSDPSAPVVRRDDGKA
ncbi:cytochrome c-type biogenesis protein [Rhodovibrionaceae bacterium A322]